MSAATTVTPLINLAELVRAAPAEELPELLVTLASAHAMVLGRMMAQGERVLSGPAAEVLTPEEAAGIAKVPLPRIYAWSRAAKWASRPSRRCLRIDGAGFRRWLASRGRA